MEQQILFPTYAMVFFVFNYLRREVDIRFVGGLLTIVVVFFI
jgi:hypothetical protein